MNNEENSRYETLPYPPLTKERGLGGDYWVPDLRGNLLYVGQDYDIARLIHNTMQYGLLHNDKEDESGL